MLQGWNMIKTVSGNIPIGQCQVCTGNLEGWQYVYKLQNLQGQETAMIVSGNGNRDYVNL